ncbi:hypothetical protein BJV82DRAFT_509020 [Fennellomyces sp. T-0311]|nr:hypothetical protein BJV82DRAFT_509020 [Fennellomyces sp. T-0311]
MSDLQRTATGQSNVSEGVIRSVPRSESQQFDDPADNCGFRKGDTGEVHYRDPDVMAPGTTREWAFYGLHRVHRWLSKHEPLMALKAATGVVLLAIPSWRVNTAQLYYEWRGQWALITMVLWMFPTTGRYIFLLIMRVSGSILGCLIGVTIWEISSGNPYGIAVLCFAFFVPIYYIFFFTTTYKVAMFLSKVTLLLVIIYEYNNVEWGKDTDEPVYVIAAKRLAMIAVGLVSSLILSLIPSPVTGRVELRKRLAKTVRDIGRLYGILVASYIVKPKRGAMPTESQIKRFRKLSTELRRQIADERNLLAHAMYEPPLRGKFPTAEYKALIDKVDNMADLVHSMGRSVLYINPEWKKVIGHTLMNDRRDYLATVMTTLKLISTTLAAKTTLPPYMIQPHEMRRRFTEDIERKIRIGSREIADPTFTRYCTYMLSSSAFINELQKLLDTVKQLVGIEDPNEWLYLHYQ